jgi:predicted ester cyclase
MTPVDPTRLRASRAAVVNEHIEAENTKDLDRMIDGFKHPRYDVVPMGLLCDGEGAVRDLIGGLVAGFPDFHFAALRLHHADDAVIVEGRMTGTHRGPWAGLAPSGRRMDVRVACVFDFDGPGLINETVYFDFASVQRQLTG